MQVSMESLIIYEAGLRAPNGRNCKFVSSNNKQEVIDYIEIMKETKTEFFEIYFHTKTYNLVSTVPHIIGND